MTETAAELLRTLTAHVVPTTTRTLEQLARVRLPGPPSRYAIASNGGHLLVDGVPDPAWSTRVAARLAGCAPLAEVESHLRATAGPFVLALRVASDLFVYAVVDRAALPDGWVDALAAWCAPRGWAVSLQGRKVYAVPRPLTKSAAAAGDPRPARRRHRCSRRATRCSTPTCSTSPTRRSAPPTASWPRRGSPETT